MFKTISNFYISAKKQLNNFWILSIEYGQFYSIKRWDSVDKNRREIPWYTYPSIEYLNNIDFSGKTIFEFGSGNSSIYWRERAKFVISVEHNKDWYMKFKNKQSKNHKLLLVSETEDYENTIVKQDMKFDVIVIDGIRREECVDIVETCVDLHSEQGFMIIFDNSDRYPNASKYLREELNLIEMDFHGFGPINHYTWTTSLFLSRNYNFNPVNDSQPHLSILPESRRQAQ